jgi:hypothetical protein
LAEVSLASVLLALQSADLALAVLALSPSQAKAAIEPIARKAMSMNATNSTFFTVLLLEG